MIGIIFLILSLTLRAEEPWEYSSKTYKPPSNTSPAVSLIHFYQQEISPICGPRSHYLPTSSEYMRQAISKHGLISGFLLGCDRLLRENNDEWLYTKVRTRTGFTKWDPVPQLDLQSQKQE